MKHRLAAILPAYTQLYAGCFWLALQLRFDFDPQSLAGTIFWATLPTLLGTKLLIAVGTGEFRRTFRHVTVGDATLFATTGAISAVALWIINSLTLLPLSIPRSVILIDASLSLLAVVAARMVYRVYFEVVRPRILKQSEPRRTLILGIDEPSIGILRMLLTDRGRDEAYHPVGFVSLDKEQKSLMAGLPVYNAQQGWGEICATSGAQHLLIPGGTAGSVVRELWRACGDLDLKLHVIPSVNELVDGRFKLTVRDVTVNDLLRREPNKLDLDSIRDYVTGKRVLVTGGAGSIGSELCRQILSLKPDTLILLDQSEYGMFCMEREFARQQIEDVKLEYVVADILDERALNRVMDVHQPQIVFHAAAYKHVPLMEDNPSSAVTNNILGTKAVADAASTKGVERFVMISTDKAVRPTSVMGASKLIAEKYVQALARHSETRFITVRFGNVLNSMGSVVPTFRQQIANGGPVTVTHEEMRRFFMTIPEAVQLVLQSGAIGSSGDILILDMGEPVKIVDLARDMIELSGLKYPDDIDIVITGMRPGEKLYEELFYADEAESRRIHPKIFCGDHDQAPPLPSVLADIRHLDESTSGEAEQTLRALKEIVAQYTDREWTPSRLRKAA